jgi:ubiquinone/menaquinone biosynthesis C-methylase UbiE
MESRRLIDLRSARSLLPVLGRVMESRVRYRFFGPAQILEGAGPLKGRSVLEIGCGTGFFTLPAAELVGDEGRLVALDVLQELVDHVTRRVEEASLTNVRVLPTNELETGLDGGSIDTVLLFGAIPAPMMPMERLLSEIHRVLRDGGTLAVWPPVPLWLPDAVVRFDLFAYVGKRGGVSRFVPR